MRPGRAGRRPGHLARDVAFELFLLVSLLAALVVPALAAFGGDPERQGLRASVGLSGLPVPALLEHPDRLADPQPSDLNATELRARLGRHFDPRVVSVRRPAALRRRPAGPGGPGHQARHIIWYNDLLVPAEDHARGPQDDDESDSELLNELDEDALSPFRRDPRGRLVPTGVMPPSIAALDLSAVTLADGTRLRSRIPPRMRRRLQDFLWAYTTCPVQHRWRDLGVRFWPRWLREGRCPAAPCSIPAGMRCRPAATRHQALLRWHCKPRPGARPAAMRSARTELAADTESARHCTWIKIQYPIITECSCGCADDHLS